MKQKLISSVFFSLILSFVLPVQASDFDLPMRKLNGEEGSLKEYVGQGKWTLVMLWETTCSICKEQEPEYAAFHEKNKDDLAEVVGVAIDGKNELELINNYVKENNLPYPNMLVDKTDLRDRYLAATDEQFRGTPTYMLFDPSGKLVGNQPGMMPAASVEKYIEKLTAQQSANQ